MIYIQDLNLRSNYKIINECIKNMTNLEDLNLLFNELTKNNGI